MRYTAELAARAQAWLALPTEQKRGGDGSGLVELGAIWAAIQGLPPVKCLQCQYSDRVHDLQAYLREYHRFTSSPSAKSDTQTTSKYQFVPAYAGQTLTDDAYGKVVTAANLTDEDAEHFIKAGFGHVFQKIGGAIAELGEKLEGEGDDLAGDQDDDQPSERETELQAELDEATQKLADQTSSYNAAYGKVVADLQASQASLVTEQQNHQATQAALDSEKQAHVATQAQLSEVQQQVVDLQAALAAATAPKAKKTAAPTTASTDGTASDSTAAQ